MNLKNDTVLSNLRSFGFTCEEKTQDGFLRYQKRIGNLLVTIANGQFENKIRVSMLQDKEGRIRTTYHDLMAYTDMIGDMMQTGLLGEMENQLYEEVKKPFDMGFVDEYDATENPLLQAPRKPKGFMAQ